MARSGWRCWRRCRPPGPARCSRTGTSNATALTDGYHLAFTIAAGLVLAAIAIGLVFLRPTRALEAMSEPDHVVEAEIEPEYLEQAA